MAEIRDTNSGATPVPWTRGNRLFGFDPRRRRLWIAGQRMHHGATGIALASAGLIGLAARRFTPGRGAAAALTGTALIAHDWKDRSVWFRRGPQSD